MNAVTCEHCGGVPSLSQICDCCGGAGYTYGPVVVDAPVEPLAELEALRRRVRHLEADIHVALLYWDDPQSDIINAGDMTFEERMSGAWSQLTAALAST